MGFKVVRDLLTGSAPMPLDVVYNTDLAGNGTNKRYSGSLVKFMDYDDIDNGTFFTFAGLTTVMENFAGILSEEVAASTTYLPNAASSTGTAVRKKIMPCGPTTIIRGEYAQYDAAGTAANDDGFEGAAAATSITATSQGTADCNIGGWLYFIDGSNAGYLHYIRDNDATTGITLRTALANAVATTDKVLVIQQETTRTLLMNDTYTGIKSEIVLASRSAQVIGLAHWIQAPGVPLQMLDPDIHDGLKISDAKFFHDFVVGGPTTHSIWQLGLKIS